MNAQFLACLFLLFNHSHCFQISSLAEEVKCPPWNGDVIFIRDPEDCAKYYQCTPSGPILKECSDGLLFDDVVNVCNWPDVVDCKGKLKSFQLFKQIEENSVIQYFMP